MCWSCTILGRFGRIFGGSRGAAELINVWRGCVGRTGSVKMRWRGWKASAPSGGRGLAGSPRGLGLALGVLISIKGKSTMGPDQVSSVLSNAEKWVAAAGRCGEGITIKTRCHKAAATRARRGMRRSIQQSLKNPASRKFFETFDLLKTARKLLPMPWWKLPQGRSSFGARTACRRAGAGGRGACPRRSDVLKTRFEDMSFSIIASGACPFWGGESEESKE